MQPPETPLSTDLAALWQQMADTYTRHPAGYTMKPEDFHTLLEWLEDMKAKAVALEKLLPPPVIIAGGGNVIDFTQQLKKRS